MMGPKLRLILLTLCAGALTAGAVLLSCREHVPLPPVKGPPLAVPGERGSAAALQRLAAQPLQVIHASPRGQLTSPHLQLTVSFSKPMVALEQVEQQQRKSPLQLAPAVAGQQRWLGSRTLVFESDRPLPGSTTFSVRVPAGVKALDGSALQKEVAWTFTTPLLAVSRVTPY